MKIKLLLSVIVISAISGCTGTQIKVSPEPTAQAFNQPYAAVGIRDTPTTKTSAAAVNWAEAFGNEMRASKFSKDIYYPYRPDDKVDILLDSQFTMEQDLHSGSHFVQSFLTGLTLFLIEPFIWYDIDYKLVGNVNIVKEGKIVRQTSATTNATISAKWLSLRNLPALSAEAMAKAKQSVFQQLMRQIEK